MSIDEGDIPPLPRTKPTVRSSAPPLVQWPIPSNVAKPLEFEYERQKFAVTRFFENAESETSVNDALLKLNMEPIPIGSLHRLAVRCIKRNPATGNICGFFACIPNWRPKTPQVSLRAKPKVRRNPQHSLSALFDRLPALEAAMCTFVIHRTVDKKRMTKVAVLSPEVVYDTFLAECKTHGVDQSSDWPFNGVAKGGKVAIERWYKNQRYLHPSAAALNELNEDTAKLVLHDYASTLKTPVASELRFAYSRVDQDEHKIDVAWTTLQPGAAPGSLIATHQVRLWAMAMHESESQAILCSSIATNVEERYTHVDILKLVHRALVPPPKQRLLRLQDAEWRYAEGACYPAELEEFARNTWSTLHMDNHSTHLTDDFQTPVKAVTRCQISFGPVAKPQARHYMEGYFAKVASWSKWFASSTGGNPNSAERRNPELAAIENLAYLPFAEEHLDVRSRNYNVTPLASLGGQTPIERLFDLLRSGRVILSPLGEFHSGSGSGNLHLLLPKQRRPLRQRHGQSLGPLCVYAARGCYMGPEFSACTKLLFGKTRAIDLYIQEDARYAFAVPVDFPDLVFRVVVQGGWRSQPHTLEWRAFIGAYAAKRKMQAKAAMPLLGPGVARGFANVASSHAGVANLLANYHVFMDRYGAGVVPLVDMTSQEADELLNYAEARDDKFEDIAEQSAVRAEQLKQNGPTEGRRSQTLDDPFGTLGGLT